MLCTYFLRYSGSNMGGLGVEGSLVESERERRRTCATFREGREEDGNIQLSGEGGKDYGDEQPFDFENAHSDLDKTRRLGALVGGYPCESRVGRSVCESRVGRSV